MVIKPYQVEMLVPGQVFEIFMDIIGRDWIRQCFLSVQVPLKGENHISIRSQ